MGKKTRVIVIGVNHAGTSAMRTGILTAILKSLGLDYSQLGAE